jgi:hypothetical protein
LTEKLMTYGLGRSLEYTDMPTVRRIVRAAAGDDYRFTALVLGIVTSPQFRRKGQPQTDVEPLAARAAGE